MFLSPFVKASEHPKSTKGDVCVTTPLTADYLQIIIPMPPRQSLPRSSRYTGVRIVLPEFQVNIQKTHKETILILIYSLLLQACDYYFSIDKYYSFGGFPGGLDGKESACSAGDLGSLPGLGRSPREGHGNPLQYSGLENSSSLGVGRILAF